MLNLEEIIEMWEADSTIDYTSLMFEISKNGNMYSKYLDLYYKYRAKKHKIKSALEIAEKDAYEYLKGRKAGKDGKAYPFKLMGEEIKVYKKADAVVQELNTKLEATDITVDVLQRILDLIKARSYEMRTIADLRKLESGN